MYIVFIISRYNLLIILCRTALTHHEICYNIRSQGCRWIYIPIVHGRWWSDSEGRRSCCCWSGRRHLLWFCGSKCNRPRSRGCVILHHDLPTVIHCNSSLVRQLEPMWQCNSNMIIWEKIQWGCTSTTIIQHQMRMLACWGVRARYFFIDEV